MTLDEYAARYSDNPKNLPVKYWPENNGSSVPETPVILSKGTRLIRFGENIKYINDGRFFSSPGTSYEQFSLPYTPTVMREYEVLQDVLSYKGIASPWFGQPGGGIQYRFDNVAIDLLKWRIIK